MKMSKTILKSENLFTVIAYINFFKKMREIVKYLLLLLIFII